MNIIKKLIRNNYNKLTPAFNIAGNIYNNYMISYEAFNDRNKEVIECISEEIGKVLNARNTFELWQYTKNFEMEFAKFCGKKYAAGMPSGTAALQTTLACLNIGKGDEVITSAHTFIATILAICNTGAVPVLVDPDPKDMCIKIEDIKQAITKKTKAILPVHMHGHVANMKPILDFSAKNNILVIEDCAQAHGASREGQITPIGSIGCFSFFASKPLGGAGNGGIIVTDDIELFKKIENARDPEGNDSIILSSKRTPGYINPMEAALIKAKMPFLEKWRMQREFIANRYQEELNKFEPVLPYKDVKSAWYSFVIRTHLRNKLKRSLLLSGIETKIEYTPPFYLSKIFNKMNWNCDNFFVANDLSKRGLSIPIHPFLKKNEQDLIIRNIKECLRYSKKIS